MLSRSPSFFRTSFSGRSNSRRDNNNNNNSSSGGGGGGRNHQRGSSSTLTPSQIAALSPPTVLHQRGYSTGMSSTSSTPFDLRGLRRLEQRRQNDEIHHALSQSRVINFNPPVDLRLVDYINPVDENLTCPICRCPFVDPVILNECDHCFCRDCIWQTWTTASPAYNPHGPRGDCPTCRTPGKLGPRSATTKILVNILDDLLVKCPKESEGCPMEVKRGELQTHASIYCGFSLVECPAADCQLPIRRKDSSRGYCLHAGACCSACHEEMQAADLEPHWKTACPDRVFVCELCHESISYKLFAEHTTRSCPAVSIPCPGAALGCTSRSKKHAAEIHARSCTFAKLAPVMERQTQRIDEQEAAQKEMSRKLEVLEKGFAAVERIVFSTPTGAATTTATPRDTTSAGNGLARTNSNRSEDEISLSHDPHSPQGLQLHRSLTLDNELPASIFPPYTEPAANFDPLTSPSAGLDGGQSHTGGIGMGGPFTSPFHHLLSMQESLRSEITRTATALAELDGRHSLQMLNENLRIRDEITFYSAQIAGLQRQVTWLTAERLQRQQQQSQPSQGAGAGESVERAVNAVNQALSGAARIVGAASGGSAAAAGGGGGGAATTRMRRGNSDEGRTKL